MRIFLLCCLNSSSSSNCGRKIVCFCRQKMELFLNVFVNFFSICGFNLCFLMELRDSFVMSCASFMVVWTWPLSYPLERMGQPNQIFMDFLLSFLKNCMNMKIQKMHFYDQKIVNVFILRVFVWKIFSQISRNLFCTQLLVMNWINTEEKYQQWLAWI